MVVPRWRCIIDLDMYAETLAFVLVFVAIAVWGIAVFLLCDILVLSGSHVSTVSQLLAGLMLLASGIATAAYMRIRTVKDTFRIGIRVAGRVRDVVVVRRLFSNIVMDRVFTVSYDLNAFSFCKTYRFSEANLERHHHIREFVVDDPLTVVLHAERPHRAFVVEFFTPSSVVGGS